MANPMEDLITGGWMGKKEDGQAEDYLNQSIGAWKGIVPPKLDEIDFSQYQYLGDLTPEQIAAGGDVGYNPVQARTAEVASMGPTAMEGVRTDPRLAQQQMASLAALQELASNGGLNAQDKANLARLQTEVNTQDRGRRDAIRQNMASRGMGGSGMDLLAQLQSAQAASDQQSQRSMDVAGMAEQRALDAMMQSGQLAGNIRSQGFGEQSQLAQARDAINQFNAQNRNNMNQFNAGQMNNMGQFNAGNQLQTDMANREHATKVGMYNADQRQGAKQASWGAKQGLQNANVDTANKQKMHNQFEIPQANFQNQATVAGGKSGAYAQGVDYYGGKSKQKKDAWGNVIGGGATIAGAYFGGPAGAAAGKMAADKMTEDEE